MADIIDLLRSHCVYCNNKNLNLLLQSFKFRTGPCGHQMCTVCADNEFKTRKKTTCPACKEQVNAASFRDKTAEEMELERESQIRKTIKSQFNLKSKDFVCEKCTNLSQCLACSDKYAEYLELAETLVWNRIYKLNEQWTDDQIAKNLHDNREKIQANKAERDQQFRKFQEEQKHAKEKRFRELRIRMLKDEEERLMRKIEKEESMKVALGQMSKSNTYKALLAARAKREEAEEQTRKEALLETRFAPAPPRYQANDMERLWPAFKSQSQPKPIKVRDGDEDDEYMDMSENELRECRRLAGGFVVEESLQRTEQLMYAGL